MTVEERDFTRMSKNVKATIWAATHHLGQMRRLLMHEKHKVWKREFGFDRTETAAEMDEKRSRTSTSPVSNLFFYRNMVTPSHPHTPDEFTLEMKVDVEGLRMEIILSQPASSQCDPSPTMRRGRYGVRGTRNAATVACDQYEASGTRNAAAVTRDQYGVTRSIASRNANEGRNLLF